ncbi:transposase [Burkholderia cepacia]|uniref:transposase n=1 Tax=Burkholderia cepacia TaxID=292 RepID=UPI0009BE8395|nr:transposase [Burkholderia cepacia]
MSAVKRGKSSKRPNFADEFKRALVEQTFGPDASVSLVARRNDVNTNLLFCAIRRHRFTFLKAVSLARRNPWRP